MNNTPPHHHQHQLSQNNNPSSTTTTTTPTSPRMTTILGSSLEVIIHEILYLRSLYPRDAFASTRYLGVACHACRHPAVVDYIYDTLVVSIPALCMGVADELILVFYDTDVVVAGGSGSGTGGTTSDQKVLERFIIAFDVSSILEASRVLEGDGENNAVSNNDDNTNEINDDGTTQMSMIVQTKVQELQRSLRDVLLKIISMEGSSSSIGRRRGQTNFSGTTTFKLCLHCRSATTDVEGVEGGECDLMEGEDLLEKCPELSTAMEGGKWFKSDTESCQFGDGGVSNNLDCSDNTGDGDRSKTHSVTRPIKSVYVPSCGLRMQLLMECEA